MKKYNSLSLLCGMLLFVACTDEEAELPSSLSESGVGEEVSNYVTLEEALQTADNVFAQMFPKEVQKRGGVKRKVANVSIVENRKVIQTRDLSGGDLSTSLYLVNYADGGGFALLSSDRRLKPIYAISDEGALDVSDTVENVPLKMFFQGVQGDIQMTANAGPSIVTNNPQHNGCKLIVNAQVNPVLWQKVRRWHQYSPYNAYCFDSNGNPSVVGCAALAIAQLFSVRSWPTSYDGGHLVWRGIKNGLNVDMLAKLLAKLGEPSLLDIKYGTTESSAKPANFRRTFMAMGYQDPGDFHKFSDEEVCEILAGDYGDGKGPILTLAWSGEHATGKGHVWVIDGYARFEPETIEEELELSNKYKIVPYTTLFHCVWGLRGGESNGYYYWGSNNAFDSSATYDVNDGCDGTVFGEEYVYNIVYMTGFKKQN